MSQFISVMERKVKAKGKNPSKEINNNKVRELIFDEDYQNLPLLETLPTFPHTNITLLYPGCGADILFPLIYLEKLFPNVKEAEFLFNDVHDNYGLIKTILDDVGIPFSETKNRLLFYWREIHISLKFVEGSIFFLIDTAPEFDVYFEKVFRIMKDEFPEYERKVFNKLKQNGVLISDSGFQSLPLEKIKVPLELSSYKEMIIGVKK
jgi:hypothetical protein